jgi:hypothetical protein
MLAAGDIDGIISAAPAVLPRQGGVGWLFDDHGRGAGLLPAHRHLPDHASSACAARWPSATRDCRRPC